MSHPSSIGAMRDRAGGGHARVTYVELFFDLVFVFAITQLSHGLIQHPTLLGLVETALLMMAVWWAWIYTAWVTNWLEPDYPPVRLMLLGVMGPGLVLAASIPQAFEGRGLIFALAFVAIQVGRSAFTLWFVRGDEIQRRNFQRILIWLVISGVFWIAGGLSEGPVRLALWGIALAIEYVSPAMAFWVPGLGRSTTEDWNVEGGHLAERCALFTIIALGESILIMGATAADMDWTPPVIAACATAFVGSLAMWWIYFSSTAHAASAAIAGSSNPGRVARIAYTYAHLLPVAGIIVAAVADEWVIHHPLGHSDLKTALAILGGPALFLLGVALFKLAVFRRWSRSRLTGLAALAALCPFALTMSPLALSVATTGVMIAVAAWESLLPAGGRKAIA